jgi:hypothetical protein
LLLQNLEFFCVPEKLRDADQKVVEEVLYFVRVGAQEFYIRIDIFDLRNLDAPLDPPQESVVLVAVEIVAGFVAQDRGDRAERRGGVLGESLEPVAFLKPGEVASIKRNAFRYFFRGEKRIRQRAGRIAGRDFARALLGPALRRASASSSVPAGPITSAPLA